MMILLAAPHSTMHEGPCVNCWTSARFFVGAPRYSQHRTIILKSVHGQQLISPRVSLAPTPARPLPRFEPPQRNEDNTFRPVFVMLDRAAHVTDCGPFKVRRQCRWCFARKLILPHDVKQKHMDFGLG